MTDHLLNKKRLMIYHHYDRDDQVASYVAHALREFREFGFHIHFVSNSSLSEMELDKIRGDVGEIVLRENVAYDFGGWQEVLLKLGKSYLEAFDELVLCNSTVYGPLFPLEEMYADMEPRGFDFWAPTDHSAAYGFPDHVQPYFLVVNKRLFQSDAFWTYWESIRNDYSSMWDIIWHAEIRMSVDWRDAGFRGGAFASLQDKREMRELGIHEPFLLNAVDYLIQEHRLPFVKIKAFRKNEDRPFSITQDIFGAINKAQSKYPVDFIVTHQRRVSPLSWQKNLPGTLLVVDNDAPVAEAQPALKVAVFAHFFYAELVEEAVAYLERLPFAVDMFVTTCSVEDAERIRERLKQSSIPLGKAAVKSVPNRGRDIAPWLMNFREEHLTYDLIVKVHLKKHSNHSEVFGSKWNSFLYNALLPSPAGIQKIVEEFERDPELGIMFPPYPPLYNMIYPQGYYGSTDDIAYMAKVLERLDLHPIKEDCQPVFSAGTMSWYRPAALKKLLTMDVSLDEFPEEPFPSSGTMGHAIERVKPYVAQGMGYHYKMVLEKQQLLDGFQMYEDRIMSRVDEDGTQIFVPHNPINVREAMKELLVALNASLFFRFPRVWQWTARLRAAVRRLI